MTKELSIDDVLKQFRDLAGKQAQEIAILQAYIAKLEEAAGISSTEGTTDI
jgi:hypothetical protein